MLWHATLVIFVLTTICYIFLDYMTLKLRRMSWRSWLQNLKDATWYIVKVCPWCGVGLLRLYFLWYGVVNKLTLLFGSAAPVKRKGARGEVHFPERPRYYVPCSI